VARHQLVVPCLESAQVPAREWFRRTHQEAQEEKKEKGETTSTSDLASFRRFA
jgi:hypothetical protein